MSSPNGEIVLVFKGTPFKIKPSFMLLSRIEDATNRSILETLQGMSEGKIRIGHLAQIVQVALMMSGKPLQVDEIGEWLLEENNLVEVSKPVTEMLVGAMTARPKT